ncbi:MAG: dihydroorotate dehydrogenase electron transfer subunit [Planctomycetaceae bacterium]|nr:dihydroorotate dehydrogenase electron transfer subunit [Planctomycetaceae bacterium]
MITTSLQTTATVLERSLLSEENYRLRLHCPTIAGRILPGQFFMLRLPGCTDPLLGRPFALYDTVADATGEPVAIDVGLHQIGKFTGLMSQLPTGAVLDIWGPLGNGFPPFQTEHLIQVAGGIGYTPFVAVSREALAGKRYGSPARQPIQAQRASLIYGVRSRALRADLSDWQTLPGLDVQICTEDGSEGHRGLVTELLEPMLRAGSAQKKTVLTCGPVRMMHAVAELCRQHGVACWASLETPMACGYGACFSCVVPVRDAAAESGWDYRRSCVEGPVFRGDQIVWERLLAPTA